MFVKLDIPKDKLLKYYEGSASTVFAQDLRGKTVRFPASILRRFVTDYGVKGTFILIADESGKLISIKNIAKY